MIKKKNDVEKRIFRKAYPILKSVLAKTYPNEKGTI